MEFTCYQVVRGELSASMLFDGSAGGARFLACARKTRHRGSSAASGRRTRRVSPDDMVVVDNLPDRIPVHRREIEVVEMYLGALLDEILRVER